MDWIAEKEAIALAQLVIHGADIHDLHTAHMHITPKHHGVGQAMLVQLEK